MVLFLDAVLIVRDDLFPSKGIHHGGRIYSPISYENPNNIFRQLRPFFRLVFRGSFLRCQ
jgi:hypothetical protein